MAACYVAGPYEVYGDALADIEVLRARGWHVEISDEKARHFPGGTTAILITKLPEPEPTEPALTDEEYASVRTFY